MAIRRIPTPPPRPGRTRTYRQRTHHFNPDSGGSGDSNARALTAPEVADPHSNTRRRRRWRRCRNDREGAAGRSCSRQERRSPRTKRRSSISLSALRRAVDDKMPGCIQERLGAVECARWLDARRVVQSGRRPQAEISRCVATPNSGSASSSRVDRSSPLVQRFCRIISSATWE
jgi:hypothetical protein